ncbi:MAG: hypothetical protein HY841_01010 [Bacteroidetes bacterium]|nr:hypothetical protein [Bacteroidota bacterium]
MKYLFQWIKIFLCALLMQSTHFLFSQTKTGVLVMAHGGSPTWEASVKNAVNPVKQKYLTEIAFGMADPMTMQEGINNLEKQGVNTIVVVPLFISSHSPIFRQAEYLLGLRKELADEPIIMSHGAPSNTGSFSNDHSHGSSSSGYSGETEAQTTLDPVVTKSQIILVKPLDADSLVAAILYERIQEFSKDPQKETIILVAHGPDSDSDNKGWLKNLDSLAKQVERRQMLLKKDSFQNIFTATVRDDANKNVYNEAKEQLRLKVQTAGKGTTVIVVPVVLATGGIEKGIQLRLEGLNYVWVNKALLPHENITKFIENAVMTQIK